MPSHTPFIINVLFFECHLDFEIDRFSQLSQKVIQTYQFSHCILNVLETHDLVDRYGISVSQMTTYMFHLS